MVILKLFCFCLLTLLLSFRIACVACPTAYHKLRSIKPESCTAVVLEFDDRFRQYGEDFIFYDYNQPLQLPETVQKQSFDVVLADPPFLAEECLLKTAETVKFLTHGKVLLCTGMCTELWCLCA